LVVPLGHSNVMEIYPLSPAGNSSNQRLGAITMKLNIKAQIGIMTLMSLFFGFLSIHHNFSEYRTDNCSKIISLFFLTSSGFSTFHFLSSANNILCSSLMCSVSQILELKYLLFFDNL